MKCERCHNETNVTTMSRFNTQVCCMDCIEKEKKHPDYLFAEAAELAAVRAGDYNFKGIGLPAGL